MVDRETRNGQDGLLKGGGFAHVMAGSPWQAWLSEIGLFQDQQSKPAPRCADVEHSSFMSQ